MCNVLQTEYYVNKYFFTCTHIVSFRFISTNSLMQKVFTGVSGCISVPMLMLEPQFAFSPQSGFFAVQFGVRMERFCSLFSTAPRNASHSYKSIHASSACAVERGTVTYLALDCMGLTPHVQVCPSSQWFGVLFFAGSIDECTLCSKSSRNNQTPGEIIKWSNKNSRLQIRKLM